MAVTRLGAGAGGMNNGLSALTYNSFNVVTSDANTVAVVGVSISVSSNSTGTTCSVTYGGVAMTQLSLTLAGSTTNRNATGIYYLFNPGTGVKSVVVTPAGAATKAGLISNCVLFSSVGAVGAAQTAAATTHAPTSVTNGYDVRVLTNGAALTSPNQTQENLNGQSVGGDGDYGLIQSAAGTGSTISFTATGTATNANSVATALSAPQPKLATLVEDFSTSTNWTLGSGVTIAGGVLTIPCSTSYVSGYTVGQYDATSSSLYAQITIATGGTTPQTALNLRPVALDNSNEIGVIIYNGGIVINRRVATTYTEGSVTTYNAVNHKWVRLSESGGSIFLDGSPDAVTWTALSNFSASTITLTSVTVIAFAGNSAGSSTSAVFDSINVAPLSLETYNYSTAVQRAATH